jgi:hypothetical protein
MEKDLPIYDLIISEDPASEEEVSFIALVDKPAIERNFLAFRDIKAAFAIQDDEQHIISGPLIVADQKIYRRDERGEFFVVFPRETVKAIAIKYFKKGYQANVNLMHDSGQVVGGVTMFESWIKDSERGIPGMQGFEDLPDGSWFGSFKVDNQQVWERIKSGEVKGFSVEGVFNYERSGSTADDVTMSAIIKILQKVNQ